MDCMQDKSHAQPIDSEVQYKQCTDCRALLPLSHYGLSKMNKDGHSAICNLCRSQFLRLKRQAKYNSKSKVDDSLIRCVRVHNQQILQHALTQTSFQCIGFIPHSTKVLRIHFGKSRYDMNSMAVFAEDGGQYFEVAYSGYDLLLIQDQLLSNLKKHNIRLEFSVVEMMASKNVLYHLWKA